MGDVYFHYTTKAGARGIMKDKKIRKSIVQDQIDARFGEGVYLTKLSPEEGGAKTIFKNNYDGRGQPSRRDLERVDKAIKITFPASAKKKPEKQKARGRDVWLYKDSDLDISKLNSEVIDVAGEPVPSDAEVRAIYKQLLPLIGGAHGVGTEGTRAIVGGAFGGHVPTVFHTSQGLAVYV